MIRWINDYLCYIDRPNPELERRLDAIHQRIPGLLQWRVKDRGKIEKTMEFASTIFSGFADDAEVLRRQVICASCPAKMLDKSGNSYCSGCSCGRWLLSKLDGTAGKLKWAGTKCPLNKF